MHWSNPQKGKQLDVHVRTLKQKGDEELGFEEEFFESPTLISRLGVGYHK